MNILEGTITINGKNFELNENSIFQNHVNISVDEFCELLEQELLAKFELSNGILIYHQMTTKDHAAIDVNLLRETSFLFLRQKYYQILGENFAITCPDLNSYYLPDASIVIGKEVEYVKVGENKQVDAVSNALGIIEILSPATEKYDRTTKYDNYRKIPTLRQYTLISQDKIQVENFVRNAFGIWICTVYTSKNDYFEIIEEQFQLCVGNLYLQTSLDDDY
ncbi:MAG: Uma2 family endonuclease [Bacteroidetes bacterium]|nr:MAG: Uma2 family endonuclease [Bacteroidota bacterium]